MPSVTFSKYDALEKLAVRVTALPGIRNALLDTVTPLAVQLSNLYPVSGVTVSVTDVSVATEYVCVAAAEVVPLTAMAVPP